MAACFAERHIIGSATEELETGEFQPEYAGKAGRLSTVRLSDSYFARAGAAPLWSTLCRTSSSRSVSPRIG
jgi:hypothetical protein